jgi:alkylation response protein AidB-like acyl-CoA dehydrogenase
MGRMTPATTQAVLPLVPSDEERQIREAVRGICDGFPEDYARQKYAAGEPPTELWDALAEKGYLGVNLPEEWGGGGLGMSGLATVGEEIAAAGKSLLLIVVSPAIVGNILVRHGTDERNRSGHHEDRLRDHRAGRGHELAQPLDIRGAAR